MCECVSEPEEDQSSSINTCEPLTAMTREQPEDPNRTNKKRQKERKKKKKREKDVAKSDFRRE
jgi:hypothetical protein